MHKLDSNFFPPFISGTLKTLKDQCKLDAKPSEVFLKGSKPYPNFQLAAIIGVTSATFSGSIALCLPEKLFKEMMTTMMGDTITEITNDTLSGAAELLNIIYGQAKIVLNQQGYTLEKAIPTVIQGEALKTFHLGKGPVMAISFDTGKGEIYIEIATE